MYIYCLCTLYTLYKYTSIASLMKYNGFQRHGRPREATGGPLETPWRPQRPIPAHRVLADHRTKFSNTAGPPKLRLVDENTWTIK